MKNYILGALLLCLMACTPGKKEEVKPIPYSQQMVESHGLIDFYCNRRHHDSLSTTPWVSMRLWRVTRPLSVRWMRM